jgi:hypothetical protein
MAVDQVNSSMYGYTVHVNRFMVEATVTAFVTAGFSYDDQPTANPTDSLTVTTSGHTISGAARTVVSALVASHLAQLDHQA